MKKVKYTYNTHSLRYEKYEETLRGKLIRFGGFFSAALVFAFLIVYLAYTYLDSPKEKTLKREIAMLQEKYDQVKADLENMNGMVTLLQDRDNKIYRSIFEAAPIDDDVRTGGFGGSNRFKDLGGLQNEEMLKEVLTKIQQMKNRLYIQSKSYDEIGKLINQKNEMMASIPAIQPIANDGLKRIGSGFGWRIDPINKIAENHAGIDFVADIGTPIYATGNGVISEVDYGYGGGYGLHIIITHGFGYQTLYGHMSRVKVQIGQQVKRGEVIGYVGMTGRTTGPHVHYEVIKNGVRINPINFFFNDLTAEQYEEIMKIAANSNQAFD